MLKYRVIRLLAGSKYLLLIISILLYNSLYPSLIIAQNKSVKIKMVDLNRNVIDAGLIRDIKLCSGKDYSSVMTISGVTFSNPWPLEVTAATRAIINIYGFELDSLDINVENSGEKEKSFNSARRDFSVYFKSAGDTVLENTEFEYYQVVPGTLKDRLIGVGKIEKGQWQFSSNDFRLRDTLRIVFDKEVASSLRLPQNSFTLPIDNIGMIDYSIIIDEISGEDMKEYNFVVGVRLKDGTWEYPGNLLLNNFVVVNAKSGSRIGFNLQRINYIRPPVIFLYKILVPQSIDGNFKVVVKIQKSDGEYSGEWDIENQLPFVTNEPYLIKVQKKK